MHLPRWLRGLRVRPVEQQRADLARGLTLLGPLWLGPGHEVVTEGLVVLDGDGRVARIGGALPDTPVLRAGWIGPGVIDNHVHHAFGSVEQCLRGGVVATRDLGDPGSQPCCRAGRIVTAPGGYPSRSWGSGGFSIALATAQQAAQVVADLICDGVDLVKVALEPSGGSPVPDLATVTALVRAAHDQGLPVTAHALSLSMVERALHAGVDELAHCPVEPLTDLLVEQIAAAGVAVVGTLQTLCSGGDTRTVMSNATRLSAAGVVLLHGTDLGNGGTRPGVDPRELERMSMAGLGRRGALEVAVSGTGVGMPSSRGLIEVGAAGALVALVEDPLAEPSAWCRPLAVVSGGRLLGEPVLTVR